MMGRIWGDSEEGGEYGGQCSWSFLTRRKRVDSSDKSNSQGQLAKELTVPHLMAIGSSTLFLFSSLLPLFFFLVF